MHATQRRAAQAERRGQINIEHHLPVSVAHAECQGIARHAGIVDHSP
jgi:hypothetical protein